MPASCSAFTMDLNSTTASRTAYSFAGAYQATELYPQ